MELTFGVAVKDIWQLQPSLLHPSVTRSVAWAKYSLLEIGKWSGVGDPPGISLSE